MALLQLALDFLELKEALRVAREASEWVDVLEAGTPLIKAQGMEAVRRLRAQFPEKALLADMKCMDAGGLEARLAFEAGADWMTVCAQASGATVEGAVAEARQRGRRVMVDLIGCRHWVERARELEPLGPHMFLIHVGLDEQKALGRERLFEALEEFSRTIGVPFALAGGLGPADVPRVKPYGPRVVVVGGYICRAAEPAEAARRMKEALA